MSLLKNRHPKVILIAVLGLLAILVFVVAVNLFSSVPPPGQPNRYNSSMFMLYGKEVTNDDPQQLKQALAERPKFIERALKIREILRPLSAQHKADISRLLTQTGDEPALFDALNKKLPPSPLPAFYANGLNQRQDPLTYSWDISDPFAGDDQSSPQVIAGRQQLRARKLARFQAFHDYPISQSGNGGVNTITVWVSGRVTETLAWKDIDHTKTFVDIRELSRESEVKIKDTFEGKIITLKAPFEFYP